jgi:hypothetical protein
MCSRSPVGQDSILLADFQSAFLGLGVFSTESYPFESVVEKRKAGAFG